MLKFRIWKIIPMMLLVSVGLFTTPALSETFILPKVENGSEPIIDGNITSFATEWKDSIIFNTTVNGQDAQIRIISNDTNLNIGFNFTTLSYVPVNDSAFVDNENYTANLQTHDWIVLQFDNNLDQSPLGTQASPDDIVVVNQEREEAYDGYAVNNATHPFFRDTDNNGTDDGVYAFANDTNYLVYEFSKPYGGEDTKGYDLDARKSVFQFKINTFFNQTSNATIFSSTEWFTFRVNETGTGVALQTVGDTTVNLNILEKEASDYKAMSTALDQFGFDSSITSGNITIGDDNLTIIVIGDDFELNDATLPQLDTLISYLELGGRAMIFLNPNSAASAKIASRFGIEYLSNKVLTSDNSTDLTFSASDINQELRYISQNTLATDRTISSMTFSSAALNISATFNRTAMPYMLRQDYQIQNIFAPSNLYYDINDNSGKDDSDIMINDSLSLGLSINLLKGGRISLFASNSMLTNDYMTMGDNLHFLLRIMPWNAKLVDTLEVQSVELDNHVVFVDDQISITVNASDSFGNAVDGMIVDAILTIANNPLIDLELTATGTVYTGVFDTPEPGAMKVKVIAHMMGYGFAEGEQQDVLVRSVLGSFNDLSELSWIVGVLFLLSFVLVVYTFIKTKN